jgi:hypothetical protein
MVQKHQPLPESQGQFMLELPDCLIVLVLV